MPRDEPLSEELVYEGAIFSVHRETWPDQDHPLDLVRHVGAAGVVPITPDGDVILVRQRRPAIRDRLVEIPAGLLDQRDEDALTCATRELFEETGYRHTRAEFLGGVYTTAGFSDEYIHLFWAATEREPAGEPEDGIELVVRPFAEMARAARAGRLRDAKTALAILLAEARGVVGNSGVG
jgi:ADP-ribose pyrophosphatase